MRRTLKEGPGRPLAVPARMILAPLLCLFLAGAALPRPAAAHPHVFVDCNASLVFNDTGIAVLRQTWHFDEFFSAMILGDLGLSLQNDLDETAQRRVRAHAFDNLKNFGYFTYIYLDGKEMPTPDPTRFSARVEYGQLVYEFDMPLPAAASGAARRLTFAVYDESFYTFMDFPPRRIEFDGAHDAFAIAWDVRDQTDKRYYFGQITPIVVDVTFSRNQP